MKELRTNYVKLSLTDSESEILQKLSDSIGKPVSSTIRELISYGALVGYLQQVIEKAEKEAPQLVKLVEQALEGGNRATFIQNRKKILDFKREMLSLYMFNTEWRALGNETGFHPIVELAKKFDLNDPYIVGLLKNHEEELKAYMEKAQQKVSQATQ
jgi:hypothetical protein